MLILLILGIVTAYLIGSSLVARKRYTFFVSEVLFVFSAVIGIIYLQLWGLIYIIAMIIAAFIVLLFKMGNTCNKFKKYAAAHAAADAVSNKLRKEYANEPVKSALVDSLNEEKFIPGRASRVNNKSAKQEFAVSTIVREIELVFENHKYKSTVESCVFKDGDALKKPIISIELLGGNEKNVTYVHGLVTDIIEREQFSNITNGNWWEEYLLKQGLTAKAITEYQEWYKDDVTSIVVQKTKHNAA